jgi:cyanophycinase
MTHSPGRILLVLGLVCLIMAGIADAPAQKAKGHLVIIGGGERTSEIMKRFVDFAGGTEKANIIVIPLASGNPQKAGRDLTVEFKSLGVKNVDWLQFNREQAMSDTVSGKFSGVTGVYFTGGDQIRVTRVIVGTPLQQKLIQLYRDGAVIGGTSAGAAIMSKVMITGDELINKDTTRAFVSILKGNVQTVEGLGFLDQVVVDQHFIKRKRLNRLISVVLEHPDLPGIGIDESTALLVNPDGTFEVLGEGTVMVFDGRTAKGIHTDPHGNLAARNIVMHLYSSGEKFDLRTATPTVPPTSR